MATEPKKMSTLTAAPAADTKTPLHQTYAASNAAKGAPQAITMEESACPSYVKTAAERAVYTGLGAAIGAGIGFATCSTSITAAISAGLCLFAGPEAAACCFSKCDNGDILLVNPRELPLRNAP